jgi:hypothetical protein
VVSSACCSITSVIEQLYLIIGYTLRRIDIIFFEVYSKTMLMQGNCVLADLNNVKVWRVFTMTVLQRKLRRGLRAKLLGLTIFFLYTGAFTLHAQTERTAVILASSGGGFTLVRGGSSRMIYTPASMPAGGVALRDSDTVQTSSGTFVEARVTPGGALIRMAENTMLSFDSISSLNNNLIIRLMYGRIRVEQESKTETIIVKSGDSMTEMQTGDINFDYIVSPDTEYKSQPVLAVSTISGAATVIPSDKPEKPTRIKMRRNVTLTVDPQSGKTKRRSMRKEIPAYWSRVITKEIPVKEIIARETPVNIPARSNPAAPSNTAPSNNAQPITFNGSLTPLEESTVLKTNGIIAGLTILMAGITVQTIGHYLLPDVDQIFYAGYVPIGIGAFVLVASYFYPTHVSESQVKAAVAASE